MAAVDTALADQITTWGPKSEKKTITAIDAIVETHDPGALRHTKDAPQERGTEFGFLSDAAGFMTVWARMYAPDGAALEQRVNDMAHSVCAEDPRTIDDRRNDALAAIATGTGLHCECDNPDCPRTRDPHPTKDVIIHVIAPHHTLNHAHTLGQHTPQTPTDQRAETKVEAELEAEPEAKTEPEAEAKPVTTEAAPAPAAPKEEVRLEPIQPPAPDTPGEPVKPVAPVKPVESVEPGEPVEPVEDDAPQPNKDGGEPAPKLDTTASTSAPRQSPGPAPAFVLGAGITNAKVLAAFLDRARIRPIIHPGDAPPEPRHQPSQALQDFVRSRDLTCRFPGCDTPAHRCDLDHTVPYPAGPTCASNLKCLCRKQRRLCEVHLSHDQQSRRRPSAKRPAMGGQRPISDSRPPCRRRSQGHRDGGHGFAGTRRRHRCRTGRPTATDRGQGLPLGGLRTRR
jgi:hypothetical protein